MPPIDLSRFEQLQASGDLPSPKGVALALMRLIQQDDVTMAELARIIRTDPAFVGRLIKAANSLIGYGRRPIASVQDALTVLGLPAVRTMALGFSLLTNYRSGACPEFDYTRFWSGSLVAAVTMQALTQRTRAAPADETYCLGLLSRVGELAMATLYPRDYARVLAMAKGQGRQALVALEEQAFAMNHAELGAAMLAEWGLPPIFTEAAHRAARDEDGELMPASREYVLTQSLLMAHQMAVLCLAPEADRPPMMRRLLMLGSRLSFDDGDMTSLCDGVAREWLDWGVLLNVHAENLPPFEQLGKLAAQAPASQVETIRVQEGALPSAEDAGLVPVLRILLAESDRALRQEIKAVLLQAPFEVAEAADGFMATELALDFQPDVLLVDWQLPDLQCDELLRTLRQTRIGRTIYVLALCEGGDEELAIRAFEAGVDGVVPKPVNERLLLARVNAARRQAYLQNEIEHDREEIRHFAAELAVSNRRLQEVALTDPLTGFPNRRFFTERLTQEWAAAGRSGRPLSCLMIDVDQFKLINDTCGHDVGDEVLRGVSAAIRQGLRSHDVVARTGGDEFLVLCPDTPLEAAMVCAERVRRAAEAMEFPPDVRLRRITLSVGVATRGPEMTESESLIKRADQGLYAAKQGGRNRVSSAPAGTGGETGE